MSDYNFRGISQSNRGPSVTAYSETRYNVNSNFQLYLATQYWAVTLPTNPTAEVDIFGGVRLTHRARSPSISAACTTTIRASGSHAPVPGAAVPALPERQRDADNDTDFWEVYGKLAWEVVKDKFAVGANVYYSPIWLNTGASGLFASVHGQVDAAVLQARRRPDR